ncbi:MAG: aminotransferase class I/II-fold pyridoxal phosphate-dependent enzyme [Roseovarius sp.]
MSSPDSPDSRDNPTAGAAGAAPTAGSGSDTEARPRPPHAAGRLTGGHPVPDIHAAEPIPEAARAEIDRLLRSGDLFRYTMPHDSPVSVLERDFAAFIGTRHALAVSSCSAALFLSLKALGLAPGARVLIPGFTFSAVPSAVVHADCVPVLCEVGSNYRLDMADFEARLGEGVAAVIVSHMRGHTSDMDAIMAACEARELPVIEDAAHSLGTTWRGRNIGTIGRVGCFSFQSYKLVNAGEGGIMISDDAELIARAVIMSGAYERNWSKHPGRDDPRLEAAFARWQNRLPLYNLRMSNLAAAIIRAQIPEIPRRVRQGRANHDHVAARLAASPWLAVPRKLDPEQRAPDSIQFNLLGMSDDEARGFVEAAAARGVDVQVFGLSADNARAFWNWRFLPGGVPELPRTRAMLMRACDTRLPAWLARAQLDAIADALLAAAEEVMGARRAFGT